jgi:uncharacterized protein (TIGR00369 family)
VAADFVDPEVSGFVGNLGPVLRADRSGQVVSGFFVEERHCNPSLTCHGGWLCTFADVAMVREAARQGGRWVTAGISVDFLSPVKLGSWVESDCVTIPVGSRTCLVQGVARVDGIPVLRMNGNFRRVDG